MLIPTGINDRLCSCHLIHKTYTPQLLMFRAQLEKDGLIHGHVWPAY